MSAVRWVIRDPSTNKAMTRVYVTGKGWYEWNDAYRVYNSVRNYDQLQQDEARAVDFDKSRGKKDGHRG